MISVQTIQKQRKPENSERLLYKTQLLLIQIVK